MPLLGDFMQTVVFIVAHRADSSSSGVAPVPIGTGFMVAVQDGEASDPMFWYVVTAAHCVRSESETWVRVPQRNGEPADRTVRGWWFHPTEDVAFTPFLRRDDDLLRAVPLDDMIRPPKGEARKFELAARCYFIGLLAAVRAMGKRGIPMVRSGTLGAIYVDDVPVTGPGNTTFHYRAHLVDCHSYYGFSGSPCFIQRDRLMKPTANQISLATETFLLGVISAHFPEQDDRERNSGVAVVTPAEHITELLMDESVKADREQRRRAYRESDSGPSAIPDSAERDYTRDDFMGDLTKVTRQVEPRDEASS